MAKVLSPRTACRYLRHIEDPKFHFKTVDGESIANLIELACYLRLSEKEHFSHHVSPLHNHFANWVGGTLTDYELEDEMSLVVEKNPMSIIVMKRINLLVNSAMRTPRGREKAKMILESAKIDTEILFTNDGRKIINLWELADFLKSAPSHSIAYHMHTTRNDFADWIGDVLMDFELEEIARDASSREELIRMISHRISELEAYGAHEYSSLSTEEAVLSAKGRTKGFCA